MDKPVGRENKIPDFLLLSFSFTLHQWVYVTIHKALLLKWDTYRTHDTYMCQACCTLQ